MLCGVLEPDTHHPQNVQWLLDTAPQGQEQLLWDAAELTQQQSWDWDAYYSQAGVGTSGAYVGKPIPKFPEENVGGWTMYDHGVNNAMGTKSCATWFRQSKNVSDAEKSYHKLAMQDQFHGQVNQRVQCSLCTSSHPWIAASWNVFC